MTTQRDISARLDRAAAGARAADRVIARIDEREKFEESGMYSQKGDCPDVGVGALPSDAKGNPRFSQQAPTEAERAVDKHWPKYFAEWAKLQLAANEIAVKPHDCFENLSAQLVCSVCGAAWVEQKIGG